MKTCTITGISLLIGLCSTASLAQNIAGFWLGVTYPTDPSQAVYNYTMTITQNGNTLGGTAQTANPEVPFGGVAYLSGEVASSKVRFSEADKNGSTAVKDVCFWRGNLTYNPTDQSLTGTYESIVNGTTCTDAAGGKVELYRIVLKSGTTYCKGRPIDLVVTGKNIRWYASASKGKVLATGNTFSPKITQTTTFYITQTLYKNESPAVPITVEVVDVAFKSIATNAGCGKANGAITVSGAGSSGWQYSLNGGAFQSTPSFANLGAGTYTITVKNSAGCQVEQFVNISSDSGPIVSDLNVLPPRCGNANGEVTLVASGGTLPLTYSLDNTSFQPTPLFRNLPSGTYTARIRDASGCEASKVVTLPASKPLVILSTDAVSTTCGQANGQATMVVAGGIKPIRYSANGQSLQSINTFNKLTAGVYTLSAIDSTGCTVSQSVDVAASKGPEIADLSITPEGCGQKNGAVTVTTANTTKEADFSINSQAYQRNNVYAGLSAGTYTLTVKDATNCLVTREVVIPLNCANFVTLPTAFSPNADNMNDALTAHFSFPSLSVSHLTIYNRWGNAVYGRSAFTIASGEPLWDGKISGQIVPAGTYLYQIEFHFPNGGQHTYRKSVELLN